MRHTKKRTLNVFPRWRTDPRWHKHSQHTHTLSHTHKPTCSTNTTSKQIPYVSLFLIIFPVFSRCVFRTDGSHFVPTSNRFTNIHIKNQLKGTERRNGNGRDEAGRRHAMCNRIEAKNRIYAQSPRFFVFQLYASLSRQARERDQHSIYRTQHFRTANIEQRQHFRSH